MSARASGYLKGLTMCPNGEAISPREKLVGMVLADSHQDRAGRFTYPAVERIAEESMCDKRSCQRYLAALERKGVIARLRPENQGRSQRVFYFFCELDAIPEGWQPDTLFAAESNTKKGGVGAAGKGDRVSPFSLAQKAERVAEGWQKGDRRVAKQPLADLVTRAQAEPEQEQKQKQVLPLPPQAGVCAAAVPVGSQTGAGLALVAGVGAKQRTLTLAPAPAPRKPESQFGAEQSGDAALDAAVAEVMRGLGIAKVERRMARKLREVVALQASLGESPSAVAAAMIAAWRQQAKASRYLRCKYGAAKFFGLGIWKDENLWHWDEELLRRAEQAQVGAWRPGT